MPISCFKPETKGLPKQFNPTFGRHECFFEKLPAQPGVSGYRYPRVTTKVQSKSTLLVAPSNISYYSKYEYVHFSLFVALAATRISQHLTVSQITKGLFPELSSEAALYLYLFFCNNILFLWLFFINRHSLY